MSTACSAIVDKMLESRDGWTEDADLDGEGMDAEDAPDGILCHEPYVVCGGKCTDLMSDRENCGACGAQCAVPAYCNQGRCDCPTTLPGWMACEGVCVYVFTDPVTCGDCGVACPGGQICDGTGTCASDCSEGFDLCGSGSTLYCADLTSDISNCGGCGFLCPIVPHANPLCENRECSVACDPGWMDGNGDVGDGCECLDMGDEICDGMDNDCNGEVDEGFDCSPGAREACVLPGTRCAGARVCEDTCSWSACTNNEWQCTPDGLDRSCIMHETCSGSQTCRDDCTWSPCDNDAWNCTVSGVSEPCTLSVSNLCIASRTCQNCIWTACRESCPVTSPDCCPSWGCINLENDPLHCGSCTKACTTDQICIDFNCTMPDTAVDVIIDAPDMGDLEDMEDIPENSSDMGTI